jgi:hypothetical protein
MSEESKLKGAADAVQGLVKAIPVYQDTLQPAAQEVGVALQTVAKTIHIALAPISALVWGYDHIKEFVSTRVAEKLKGVPSDRVTTPSPLVAGPALEALRYSGHIPVLREFYANLLATSLDADTTRDAHPAFVDVLKSICPDEARIIRYLATHDVFPALTVRDSDQATGAYLTVITHFTHLDRLAGCEHPSLVSSYIDNLSRLGLVQVVEAYLVTPNTYDSLDNDPTITSLREKLTRRPGRTLKTERRAIVMTTFGKQFCRACVLEKGSPTDPESTG